MSSGTYINNFNSKFKKRIDGIMHVAIYQYKKFHIIIAILTIKL